MSKHKRGHVVSTWILVAFLSIPFAIVASFIGLAIFSFVSAGVSIFPSIPGFTQQQISYTGFSYATLWNDQFVQVEPDHEKIRAKLGLMQSAPVNDWRVCLIDPETGTTKQTYWNLTGFGFGTTVIGERLLLLNMNQQYEVVDDVLQPVDFPPPVECAIELNQELARIQWDININKFVVSRRKSGQWIDDSTLVLPKFQQSHRQDLLSAKPHLECISRGDRIDAFLKVDDRLFFREGLEFESLSAPGEPILADDDASEESSAQEQLRGWSLVRTEPLNTYFEEQQFGTLFEGKPTALIVDLIRPGYSVGHLYQLDGTTWSEIASLPFPFGSNRFRVLTRSGTQPPYVVATTSTGTGFAYVIAPPGASPVARSGPAETWKLVRPSLISLVAEPILLAVLSMLPGLGIWRFLALYRDPQYEFGNQTVRLASLGRRGLARLIDAAWIVLVPPIVGWIFMRDFDWLSLAESIKLKIDHPAIHQAQRMMTGLFILLIMEFLVLVTFEGFWGLTPGKWICRVRALRTTLRPCGFARSLARELLLVVETVQFLCWLPPMLMIALTDQQQRLGDLVSDTIVIEHNSFQRDVARDHSQD